MISTSVQSISERIEALPWPAILDQLNTQGFAAIGQVLVPEECSQFTRMYADGIHFRKRVIMQQHGFGRGEYQYFAYPLPPIVEALRRSLYCHLVQLANCWNAALGKELVFPDTLPAFLETCHGAGQIRPTPLLLKYEPGDFNCLHQDLYGALTFPFQTVVLLNEPGKEFSGGEFVLVEQKPRAQSKAEVVSLGCGEAVIFAVNYRPIQGARGFYRVNLKHGVSQVRSGQRYSLGIIFHNAP
jgi:hypothetical protein